MPHACPPRAAWREPMLWIVAGGPACVVLASVATLLLALHHPDPPLPIGGQAARGTPDAGSRDAPALVARNHAATGGQAARPAREAR